MVICAGCSRNFENIENIFEHVMFVNNKEIKFNDLIKIFNAEIINFFADQNKVFKICGACLEILETCYVFIKKILKGQLEEESASAMYTQHIDNTLLNKDHEQKNLNIKNVNLNVKHTPGRLRKILPKNATDVKVLNKNISISSKTESCKRVYKCYECGQNYSGYKYLQEHLKSHNHVDENPKKAIMLHICQQCHTAYNKVNELNDHKKSQHSDGKYKCHLCCNRVYSSKGFLLRHCMRTHNQNNINYYCGLCKELSGIFKNNIELGQHFIESHCSNEQNKHQNAIPINEQSHTSEDVGDVDVDMHEEFLDEFLLAHTNGDNSFEFPECWEDLDINLPEMLQMQYNSSVNSQHNSGNFPCPICIDQFQKPQRLLDHLSSKHNYYFPSQMGQKSLNEYEKASCSVQQPQCPYCNKSFCNVVQLKQHLRIVHIRNKRHICQLCDKQFSTVDHLKKHVLSQHQNDRKHICHVCAKRFTQSVHLSQHMVIHTTGKTLKCSKCSSKFWRKVDLRRHQRLKHNCDN